MPYFKPNYLLALICFITSCLFSLKAQEKADITFSTKVKEVIDAKHKSYQYIDSTFYAFKRDTLKMTYLSKKSKDANYLEGESYALNMLGIAYRDNSFYDRAIATHKQAKKIADESNNISLRVISLNMLGVVYRRLDLIRAALDHHKEALDLAETIENPSPDLKRSIAVSQNSMGNIYLALKQYDLALKQFNKSLTIEKELKNKLGLAINYHNIGYALEANGFLNEALKYYENSLQYNNEINSEVGRAICYNSIGKIYIKQENYEAALLIINNALEKSTALNDQYYIATSYINLGWLQLKQNQLIKAQNNLEKALQITEDYNLKSSKIEVYNHLSELHTLNGNYKTALKHYKSSVTLDETITNERNQQYVNDLIIKYDTEKKNNEIIALAKENEIVKLKLEQNRKTLLLGIFGLLLFAAVLFVLYRQRQLKNEKEIITLEQDILRNQMNPHFIFNSLNSIKLYIINNEKENAVYYLNKFSKLIRKILVASTEKETTLEEELETMALYMNIENIRFSNEILYTVNINTNTNTSLIKVPSLILQPFLENAIWHGLSLKETDKQIILDVEINNSAFVTVTITDNGLGRVASQKLKKQKTLKRKSVGISLTKERLLNFSKSYNTMYSLKIEDLYNSKNEASGTKIILDIPIKKHARKTA